MSTLGGPSKVHVLWLLLGACASSAPTAEPAVPVAESGPESASDTDTESDTASESDTAPVSESVSDTASEGELAVPDDSVVPEDPVVVRLFGIEGCGPPPSSNGVLRVRARTSHGPYPFAVVRRVIRRSGNDALRECYAGTDAHAACRNITAAVELWLAPDGSVSRVSAAASEPATARCVEDALEPLRFPEPDGGGSIRLRFPLRFRVLPD